MKSFLQFILLLSPILYFGCDQTIKPKFENEQQQNFDNFLDNKRTLSNTQINDIQEKEFFTKFENELYDYIDSVGLLVNWKGTIKNIKTEESGNSTAITFEINYQPEEYREISFYCTHIANTDSLATDYIFNKVKNIGNLSIVYFDGFIRTNNKNQVDYYMSSTDDDLNIAYPKYNFWIIDIGPAKRNDSLSVNLKAAIDFTYKLIDPLKRQYLNEISKEESNRLFKSLLPEFNMLKSKLTYEESLYTERLNTCLVYNFMYSGD